MMLLLLIMLHLSQKKDNPEYNPDYSGMINAETKNLSKVSRCP